MYSQLFFDGVDTLIIPQVVVQTTYFDDSVGHPCVVYGSDNRKFYYSYNTIIPN